MFFGSNYVVEEVLGEGRAGIVYLCHDRKLDRRVALKALRPELADPKELRRFLGEARILANLSHDNVVHLYDLDESVPFLVMEYFPGLTLRELCRQGFPAPDRSIRIMLQVARGLEALHRLNIVHRDLSPNNILVGPEDRTKILDLGLARSLDMSSTSTSEGIVGTVKYVSPDVVNGKRVTASSDIFSFGAILYELLAGQNPFEAEDFMSVLYNIAERPHRPLGDVVPALPGPLHRLVDACLAKDPERRPSNMAAILDQLQQVSGSSSLPATQAPQSQPTPHGPGRRRNPYLNRLMIKRPSEFFGRSEEVGMIYSRLETTPPGSISVVGERKIGKSSLLNYVYSRKNREEHLSEPDSVAMLFLDLQSLRGGTVDAFVDLLIGIAALELSGRVESADLTRDIQGIKQLAERTHAAGVRLILLLDEFETITSNPNFGIEFFSFLRSLPYRYNVGYVTSTAQDLQKLCHTQEIKDSPFFNIFSLLPLSVFRRDEALALIAQPSAEVGFPLDSHANDILDMAGLFPFFIQVACSHCLECAKEHPGASFDLEDVRKRFYLEARLHYRFLWDKFDASERSVIQRVTTSRRIPEALRHVEQDLERRNYLQPAAGRRRLFSTSFQKFVESEVLPVAGASRLRRWMERLKP